MSEARDIADEVRRIIRRQLKGSLKVDADQIKLDSSFADLGADSLHMVELVLAFEEEFAIEIPEEDTENIRLVQDAIDYIGKRLAS